MQGILLLLACLSVSKAQVVRGTTSFATKLYDALPQKEDNLIFSPLSVHTVLSLLYQGAAGKTAENLSKGLQIPDALSTARQYKDIVAVLNSKGNVTIELANHVYVKKDYKLKENFRQVAAEYFSAEADNLDFLKGKEAAETVNAWVRNKTHDKIDKLVKEEDFDGDTRAVLLNAIYFKGLWEKQFEKRSTKADKFYISETETVDCEMMTQRDDFFYAENSDLDAQLIKLPYKDSRFNMIIVLPNKKTGVNELEKKLVNADVNALLRNFHSREVILYLPKFKIESTIELNDPLMAMGLSKMFEDTAEFPNLIEGGEPLKVSKVVQKAFIEVNEEGAEAAAATDVFALPISADYELPKIITVNRPFLYYITVKVKAQTKNNKRRMRPAILFVGRMSSPTQENKKKTFYFL